MKRRPLAGVRVLSLEQAAALPFASRHLVDLGAEVIRVQAPGRMGSAAVDPSLFRGKRMLGLDLGRDGGPAAFLRLAEHCDIVAHNFTPRVMRKYGIDFEGVRAVNPRVIYCALSGFGATGPWADRPLFGPGAEAISGHNMLIGEADAQLPGRPGTVTYADYLCGTNLLLAILDAVHARRRGDAAAAGAMFIDISLYESAVAQLGGTLAGRQAGGTLPGRIGNADHGHADRGRAVHGVFACENTDHCIAIACNVVQARALRVFLGLPEDATTHEALARAIARHRADDLAHALQARGVPALTVADPADIARSRWLWSRGHLAAAAEPDALPVFGPLWGGGAQLPMARAEPVGAANEQLLADVAGYASGEIAALRSAGTIGEAAVRYGFGTAEAAGELHVGMLSRVDGAHEYARTTTDAMARARALPPAASATTEACGDVAFRSNVRPRLLELPGGVGSAWAARLLAGLGWDVVKAEPEGGDGLRRQRSRWGDAAGARHAYVNAGKRSVLLDPATLRELAAAADVVLGDLRPAPHRLIGVPADALRPRQVRACLSPFGVGGALPVLAELGQLPDLLLQAASGFLFLTGEHDQLPQQLPPDAAAMLAGAATAAAIVAASLAAMDDGRRHVLDLSEVEPLTAFAHAAVSRYQSTGAVLRREGRAKHALRMAPTRDGFVYCAPGAVQSIDMGAMAALLDDPVLSAPRFATATARMEHWDEYAARLCTRFATRDAAYWFEAASAMHLTFSLVQTMDDLARCPQLEARGLLQPMRWEGHELALPVLPFRTPKARTALAAPSAPADDTAQVLRDWLATVATSNPGDST